MIITVVNEAFKELYNYHLWYGGKLLDIEKPERHIKRRGHFAFGLESICGTVVVLEPVRS